MKARMVIVNANERPKDTVKFESYEDPRLKLVGTGWDSNEECVVLYYRFELDYKDI